MDENVLHEHCKIIGPAYVYEYMYGKAVGELDNGDLDLQMFHIVW